MKEYIEKEVTIDESGLKEVWISNHYKMIPSRFLFHDTKVYSLVIPPPVKTICSNAFAGCSKLTSISLPDSLVSLGRNAFKGCEELSSIILPDSLVSIGSCAFMWCEKITSITIPCNVKEIGGYAFSYCKNLRDVTILGHCVPAFYGCKNLSSITIGENLDDIKDYALYGCKNIKSIVVDKNNKYYDSRNNCNAIIETKSDTLILACNHTKIPNGIKRISYRAFQNCGRMKTLSLPNSLECIESIPENIKKIIVPKGRKREFKKMLPFYKGILLIEQER